MRCWARWPARRSSSPSSLRPVHPSAPSPMARRVVMARHLRVRRGRLGTSARGMMPCGPWTRWRRTSAPTSPRARCRSSSSARSAWSRRIFSRFWKTSLRMRYRRRKPPAASATSSIAAVFYGRSVVAKPSSQKFIGRNRAPRVQIEYDVELYGAQKKVQIPFVMGVMADLSGDAKEPLPSVDDRKYLNIDVDNFDERMKSMKPRVAISVPNTLTGEGNLAVDLTFESMDDFSPAAVARKVDSLNKLLEARMQLSNLITYMDGKAGAEELIAKALNDPALLKSLVSQKKPEDGNG